MKKVKYEKVKTIEYDEAGNRIINLGASAADEDNSKSRTRY